MIRKKQKRNPPGLSLLGRSNTRIPSGPREARLETFLNKHPARDYVITLDCPDFTSLCPVTGQPDFAHITIRYVPGKRCVETKSLKLYLASYRNTPAFNEDVVNRILEDLVEVCGPRTMRVEGRFAARGGIALSVVAEHGSGKE